MYICVCVCMYIYIYVYTYTYLSIYLSLSIYIYIYIYVCLMHTGIPIFNSNVSASHAYDIGIDADSMYTARALIWAETCT